MATKYLINPSGVMIKPRNKAHALHLLNKGGAWTTDPVTGDPVQTGSGFRVANADEVAAHQKNWDRQCAKMRQQDLQAKKANANLVMMAPDEATLERIIETREATREANKAQSERDRAALAEPFDGTQGGPDNDKPRGGRKR